MKKRTFIKPKFDLKVFTLCIILYLTTFLIVGCKKHDNENHDPFTSDQLSWVKNNEKPKYRCIKKIKDSQGNINLKIDTVESQTKIYNYRTSEVIADEYVINYYYGAYYFWLGNVNEPSGLDTNSYSLDLEINNKNDFIVILTEIKTYYNINKIIPKTVTINGVSYNEIYVIEGLPAFFQNSIVKIYFKKGIGYLYLEQANGNNATMIQ